MKSQRSPPASGKLTAKHVHARADDQSEVAGIRYETNILGTKGPRRMTAVIPAVATENSRLSLSKSAAPVVRNTGGSLLERSVLHLPSVHNLVQLGCIGAIACKSSLPIGTWHCLHDEQPQCKVCCTCI